MSNFLSGLESLFAKMSDVKATDLKTLRKHEDWKTSRFYEKGSFWFTPAAADGQPAILISKGLEKKVEQAIKDKKPIPLDGIDKKYLDWAKPNPVDNYIVGTYSAKKGGSDSYYKLEVDQPTLADPKKKAVYDKILKDPKFELRLKACLAFSGAKTISFEKKVVGIKAPAGTRWVVTKWNLTRVLCGGWAPAERGKPTVLEGVLPGAWAMSEDGKTPIRFVTSKGIVFPPDLPCEVVVYGPMVDKAFEGDAVWAMKWRDCAVTTMKEKGKELFEKLAALDATSEAKAAAAEKKLGEALEEFRKAYEKEVVTGLSEQYFDFAADHVELKAYEYDCKVEMAKSAVLGVAGVIALGLTWTTGAGAILGLLGAVKSFLELTRDALRFTAEIDGYEKKLTTEITRTYVWYLNQPCDKCKQPDGISPGVVGGAKCKDPGHGPCPVCNGKKVEGKPACEACFGWGIKCEKCKNRSYTGGKECADCKGTGKKCQHGAWHELGRTVAERLPGGALVLAATGAQTTDQLKKDVEAYKQKISKSTGDIDKANKAFPEIRKRTDENVAWFHENVIQKLERKEDVKKFVEGDPHLNRRYQKLQHQFQEAMKLYNESWDNIVKMVQDYDKRKKEVLPDFQAKLKDITDSIPPAVTYGKKFLAATDMMYSFDLTNIPATGQAAATSGLTLLADIMTELKVISETGNTNDAKSVATSANDTSSALKGLVDAFSKLKK